MVSLIETQDGSHSLHSDQFGVSYHSKYGAIQESNHVFLKTGLGAILPAKASIRVFEMGFGSGLNAFLSLLAAEKAEKQIYYEAVEAFPLSVEQAGELNYAAKLSAEQAHFEALHQSPWGQPTAITPHFTLLKWQQKLQDAPLTGQFDVVYYDAFAPRAQPELWEFPVLKKVYDAMATGGVFVTYCAKGVVKRTLKEIGFQVEGLPGPPGKREMTRATKV